LDHTTGEFLFGTVIAVYSVAQIVSAPLFGYWSNRAGQTRWPLIVGSGFALAGNVLYALVELVPVIYSSGGRRGGHIYWLALARFIGGVGASNIGLLKAYASASSTVRDRRKAMAFITGGYALGLSVGPALQSAFVDIGHPGWRIHRGYRLHISMFTAPAWFAALLNVISIVLLLFFFKESFVGVLEEGRRSNRGSHGRNGWKQSFMQPVSQQHVQVPKYDRLAAVVCYAMRFTQMFVVSNIGT